MIKDQQQCYSTTWIFSGSRSRSTVELVEFGQIGEDAKAKSDRLSVTENCSLVVKKVTVEDVGYYTCRQYEYKGANQSSSDSEVYLSVVSMTEYQNHDEVTLICSLWTYEACRHTVKWLYEGKEVDEDNRGVTTSQSLCSASVTFKTTRSLYKCSVTDGDKEQQLFPFRLQSAGKKAGPPTKTKPPPPPTTTPTTTTTKPPTTIKSGEISRTEGTTTTGSGTDDAPSELQGAWWRFIIVSVGLSALLISVVTVNMWTRTKGNKSQREENREHEDEDKDEGTVIYENTGEPSASVRLH